MTVEGRVWAQVSGPRPNVGVCESSAPPATETMTGILMILGLLVALLHLFSGLVGAIWLLVLGEWSTVGVGLIALVLAGLVIRVALFPGLWLFGIPAAVYQRGRRPVLARIFYALIGVNTVVVMGAWCLLFAWLFLSRAEPDTRIPLLLWSYAVAVTPWARIARKNAEEEAKRAKQQGQEPAPPRAQMVTYLVQLAFLCGGVAWFFGWTSFQLAALPFWSLALVLMAITSIQQQEEALRPRFRQVGRPGTATIEGEGEVNPHDRDRHGG